MLPHSNLGNSELIHRSYTVDGLNTAAVVMRQFDFQTSIKDHRNWQLRCLAVV